MERWREELRASRPLSGRERLLARAWAAGAVGAMVAVVVLAVVQHV